MQFDLLGAAAIGVFGFWLMLRWEAKRGNAAGCAVSLWDVGLMSAMSGLVIGRLLSMVQAGINPLTAENLVDDHPLDVSFYNSVSSQSFLAFDAFNPSRNFRDPGDADVVIAGTNIAAPLANQNGVVFFPGSAPLYVGGQLVGGFGVSGDGVDQDDVVTAGGFLGFEAPDRLRVDQFIVGEVRLPYVKFNRNPFGD